MPKSVAAAISPDHSDDTGDDNHASARSVFTSMAAVMTGGSAPFQPGPTNSPKPAKPAPKEKRTRGSYRTPLKLISRPFQKHIDDEIERTAFGPNYILPYLERQGFVPPTTCARDRMARIIKQDTIWLHREDETWIREGLAKLPDRPDIVLPYNEPKKVVEP